MSRINSKGYRIEYPNKLAYAGMPAIVRVSNLDASYIGVSITIKVGEEYYTEVRMPYEGEAVFDLSRYMQLAFIDKDIRPTYDDDGEPPVRFSNASQLISVTVSLTEEGQSSTSSVLSFDTEALLGHISYGQSNGQISRRKWFYYFPQTLDFYVQYDSSMWIILSQEDEELYIFDPPYKEHTTPYQGYLQLNGLRTYNDVEWASLRELKIIGEKTPYLVGDNLIEGQNTICLMSIDLCKSGVYLRWLNHLGQWCYYLFRATGRNYTTKEEQSWQDGILSNDNEVKHQQLSQRECISLGAKLVDADTFDYLLSITYSPIVEVLANASEYVEDFTITPIWERVSIVAGSYARTSATLQDFIVSIARNARKSQML